MNKTWWIKGHVICREEVRLDKRIQRGERFCCWVGFFFYFALSPYLIPPHLLFFLLYLSQAIYYKFHFLITICILIQISTAFLCHWKLQFEFNKVAIIIVGPILVLHFCFNAILVTVFFTSNIFHSFTNLNFEGTTPPE